MRNVKRKSSANRDAIQLRLGYRDSLPFDPIKRALELASLAAARDEKQNSE